MEELAKSWRIKPFVLIGASFLLGHYIPSSITAAEHPVQESIDLKEEAPDSIQQAIEERDELVYDPRRRTLFPSFYYALRKKRLDWWQKHRVDFTLTYDVLTQFYNDRDTSIGGTAGDLTLSGRWLILGERFHKPIYLNFRVRDRRAYSEYAPADIQGQTDLIWGTVKGFNDAGFQVPDLFFDQQLREGRLSLRYGQLAIDKFFDKHAMRSAKRFFLNRAFSDNPTVNFPSYGAGFVATWKPSGAWDFSGGGSNIQGTNDDEFVNFGLDSTALFGALQTAYNFTGLGGRDARIQVMGWQSDGNEEDEYKPGNGFSLTLEHGGLADSETYALRLAQSAGLPSRTDTMMFFCYGREVRGFDSIGAGIGTGSSSTTSTWQTVLETYYRWQITKELVVTPDLQLIFGDDLEGDSKTRIVGGIRMSIVF